MPFLRQLAGAEREKPLLRARIRVAKAKGTHQAVASSYSPNVSSALSPSRGVEEGITSFLLARYSMSSDASSAELAVELLPKGSGMLRPLAAANCWVFVREDQAQQDGELVECWPLKPS
jgi:molybdopterin biosynthesis enzyme